MPCTIPWVVMWVFVIRSSGFRFRTLAQMKKEKERFALVAPSRHQPYWATFVGVDRFRGRAGLKSNYL